MLLVRKEEAMTEYKIPAAIERLKSAGPIFTSIHLSKPYYDAVMQVVDTTNVRSDEVHNISGIRIQVNKWLPPHVLGAYDTEEKLWIMDLRAPEKLVCLSKTLPADFFRP